MTLLTVSLLLALQSPEIPSLERELGSTLFLQAATVDFLELDPGTHRLASCASGGEVALWDAATGDRLGAYDLEIQRAVALEFLPEGRLLVGGTDDHLHLLKQGPDGALLAADAFEAGLGDLVDLGGGLAVSPDRTKVAVWQVTGGGGGVTLADLSRPVKEEGARLFFELDGFRADAAAWSPDGDRLAIMATNAPKVIGRAGTRDGDSSRIYLFDAATGEELGRIVSKEDLLQDLGFGPQDDAGGGLFVAGGAEGLYLWDLADGRQLSRFGDLGAVTQLELSPDGGVVTATGPDGLLEAWQLSLEAAPELLYSHKFHRPVASFALDGDEHLIAGQGRRIHRWRHADWSSDPEVVGHSGTLVALDASGDRLVSVGMEGSVILWDWKTGVGESLLTSHVGLVFDAGLSPDGTRLVTGGQDATMRVWDLTPGEGFGSESLQFPGRSAAAFTGVAFSPQGDLIAGVCADGILWIVDAESGQSLRSFEGLAGLDFQLAFSEDGQRLAIGGSEVRVWDTNTWELLCTARDFKSTITAITFTDGGGALAVGLARRTVVLVDVATGSTLFTSSPLPSRVSGLAFTALGLSATSVRLGGIRLLDAELAEAGFLAAPDGIDVSVLTAGIRSYFAASDTGRIQVWK